MTHPEHFGEPDPACSLCAVELPRRPRHGSTHDRGGSTLEEIAREFGVTRERIRQIEKIALVKARRACKRMGIRLEDALNLGHGGGAMPAGPWDGDE